MTRKFLVIILLVAGWSSMAAGDIVYMRDGSKHEGVVRQEGEIVFVETSDGVVELPADQVVYISVVAPPLPQVVESPTEDSTLAPNLTPEAAVDLPPPPTVSSGDFTGGIVPAAETFSLDKAVMPESIVFSLMRQADAASGIRQTLELHTQIEQWQAAAHDRQRRVAGQWRRPGDFTLGRQRYEELLADAKNVARELKEVEDTDPRAEAKRAEIRGRLNAKLLRASGVWLDDETRMFLTGIAHYQTASYSKAVEAFDNCRTGHPFVAAYQQGFGMALMEFGGRELDALEACLNELKLHPNNPLALLRVQQAMQNVPGVQTKDERFVEANEYISEYPESAFRAQPSKTTIWHMPGNKGWLAPEAMLPVPTYDRLVYRQGVAVPLSANTLIVDREVVRNALEIYILIDEKTIVSATVLPPGNSDSDVLRSLSLIRTNEAEFQPVAASENAQFIEGSAVISYGLSIFPEMGTEPRQIVTKITAALEGRAIQLGAGLAAGESAAPVLTGDRRLVGFLAGRTDFRKEGGGEDVLIPVSELAELVKRGGKTSGYSSSSNLRRQSEPVKTEAMSFVVYCISSETLD